MGTPPRLACRVLLLGLLALATVPGVLTPAGSSAQIDDLDVWARSFPSALTYDLPSMTLLATELPATGLVATGGHLQRPVEEAATFAPLLNVDQDTLLREMRDSGWKSRYIAEARKASRSDPDMFGVVGWSSIAEFEDVAGAMRGFALLDESGGDGVEVIQAEAIGDASRVTRYAGATEDGTSFERIRHTFVLDDLIGSVAVYWYGEEVPDAADPAEMVIAAQQLLERMQQVAADDSANLPGLVVRMSPTADLDIDTHDEAYYALGGNSIPHYGDSLAELQNATEFLDRWGIEANYLSRTLFAASPGQQHGPYYMVQLFRLGSSGRAVELVRGHAQYDDRSGYVEISELSELPVADGAVAGVSYVYEWDDGSADSGYRIWVQVGATVAVVEASAPGGVDQALMFDLVESQLACLEFGNCAPIPVPFPVPPSVSATPGT